MTGVSELGGDALNLLPNPQQERAMGLRGPRLRADPPRSTPFAIVLRIARCSPRLLARMLPASRSSAEPSRLVTRPPASATISAPAATSHGRSPNPLNASTRPHAT